MPGYEGGGHVTMPSFNSSAAAGAGAGMTVGMHVAIMNTRQDQREFMTREGFRVVIDQLTRRSNTFKA